MLLRWTSSSHSCFCRLVPDFLWWVITGYLIWACSDSLTVLPSPAKLWESIKTPRVQQFSSSEDFSNHCLLHSILPPHVCFEVLSFLLVSMGLSWPLWIIPSCHCPGWTTLAFVFHFSSAEDLAHDSAFSSLVSAEMQVLIQHSPDAARATELCCPLCRRGNYCPYGASKSVSCISIHDPMQSALTPSGQASLPYPVK